MISTNCRHWCSSTQHRKIQPSRALHEAERLDGLGAEPRGDQAAVRPEFEGQLEDGGDRLLHRDLDVLAAAAARPREEGGERRDGGVQPRLESRLLAERPERRQLRMRRVAVQRGDPPGAPEHEVGGAPVGARSGDAERRDRGHHQAGVERVQAVPVEAVRRHLGRMDVVDQQIGAGDEAVERLAALRASQVEGDAALVGVQIEEEPAPLRMRHAARKRAALPRRVAPPGGSILTTSAPRSASSLVA